MLIQTNSELAKLRLLCEHQDAISNSQQWTPFFLLNDAVNLALRTFRTITTVIRTFTSSVHNRTKPLSEYKDCDKALIFLIKFGWQKLHSFSFSARVSLNMCVFFYRNYYAMRVRSKSACQTPLILWVDGTNVHLHHHQMFLAQKWLRLIYLKIWTHRKMYLMLKWRAHTSSDKQQSKREIFRFCCADIG